MKRIIALAILLLLCLAGCGKAQSGPTETAPQTLPATEPITAPPETTAPPATVPAETEPAPVVLHSGLREDGSFTEGTLFIGDSQTYLFVEYYLRVNDLLGDARYTAQCGSQVTAFFDDSIRPTLDRSLTCAFSPEFEGLTFREAAETMGEAATAIYIMWGTNFTHDATADTYIAIVDHLLASCPNATIHLQLIPKGEVAYITVNERITGAWEHYQAAGEPRVLLVDTCAAIGDFIQEDGVHVGMKGRGHWYDALVAHAADNALAP